MALYEGTKLIGFVPLLSCVSCTFSAIFGFVLRPGPLRTVLRRTAARTLSRLFRLRPVFLEGSASRIVVRRDPGTVKEIAHLRYLPKVSSEMLAHPNKVVTLG